MSKHANQRSNLFLPFHLLVSKNILYLMNPKNTWSCHGNNDIEENRFYVEAKKSTKRKTVSLKSRTA